MTCLTAYQLLCGKEVGVDPVESGILRDIVALTSDSVANVRFKAVKTLKALAPLIPQKTRVRSLLHARSLSAQLRLKHGTSMPVMGVHFCLLQSERILPVLRRLKTDSDEDVVFYANDALAAISSA